MFKEVLQSLDEIIRKHRIVPTTPQWLALPDKASTIVKHVFADGSEEIDFDELIKNIDDYTDDDGLFIDDDKLFVVYINTVQHRGYDPVDHPKWHVAHCGTLQMMKGRGQMHKYARRSCSAEGKDPDRFMLVDTHNGRFQRKLQPCKRCLGMLGHLKKGYREQENYTFSDYVAEFAHVPKAQTMLGYESNYESATTKLANTYVDNWDEISAAAKKRDGYRCAHCQHVYKDGFLESHHQNRNKRDNSRENLLSLCILCHCIEHRKDHPQMFHGYFKSGRLSQFVIRYPHRQIALLEYQLKTQIK